MIQRYYMDSGMDPCEQCMMSRAEDGEWVMWEDVKNHLDMIMDKAGVLDNNLRNVHYEAHHLFSATVDHRY